MGKLKDLTGQRFGMLTVVRRYERNDKYNKPLWVCNCDCGKKNVIIKGSYLSEGRKWNCGCQNRCEFIDLTGKRFGHVIVLSQAEPRRTHKGRKLIMWNCKCDCGREFITRGENLKQGHKTDCGKCNYAHQKRSKATSKHGFLKEDAPKENYRILNIWSNMKDRCDNPNFKFYKDYGGRGITICSEWHDNFETFCKWALNNGYRQGLELDRIDNDGNYEPSNCHWVTHYENCRNRRSTHWLNTPWGRITTSEFCRIMRDKYGAKFNTIKALITNKHMTVDEVLEKYGVAV